MTFKIANFFVIPGETAPTFLVQLKPIEPRAEIITLQESLQNAFQIHMVNEFVGALNGGANPSFTNLADWMFAIDSAFKAIKGNVYRMDLNNEAAEKLSIRYICNHCKIERCN